MVERCPENCPSVRVRFWFRVSVKIRVGGQFSSGTIELELFRNTSANDCFCNVRNLRK